MLINVKRPGRTQLDILLDTMDSSLYKFHLTGSRFFDCASEKSDWDFYIDVEKNTKVYVINWLEVNNFVRATSSNYRSVDIVAIYQHRTQPVHIQIVADAAHKTRAQKILYELRYFLRMKELTKPRARDLWNTVLNLTRQ